MQTTLGIDLGTQSVKILFYDYVARRTILVSSTALDLHQEEGGVAEQDAAWWVAALTETLKNVPADLKASVRAIAVSGQQHGFVPLDKQNNVLAPVKLWCDTSTDVECQEIMEAMGGEEKCLELTGNKILSGYTASKILALKKHHPATYAKVQTILLPHDYLNFWLTGELCMEAGDASGTGFMDIRTRTWSEAALQAIDPDRDLRSCLPPIRVDNGPIGELQPDAANATGLVAGTPVMIGGGDNMMGAIGTGNVGSGRATVGLGTSGTVYAHANEPVIDDKGDIAAFCSSTGGWLPLLCTMNCTVTTELFRSLLNVGIDEFDHTVSAAPAGAGGVITLPFFNGERTPDLPHAKGCIVGLDSGNMTPAHLLRSGVEGATLALKFGMGGLERLGLDIDEIVLTGGGAKSAAWRQIVADVMGAPVIVPEQEEGAAFGAALQAYAGLENNGRVDSDLVNEHWTSNTGMACEPNPDVQEIYQDLYEHYKDAVAAVGNLYS